MADRVLRSVFNFLVPAAGGTSAYAMSNPSDTEVANFAQITSISGQAFCPSGVVVDNTQNASELTITIQPINHKIKCPAGAQMGVSYPATLGHTAEFQNGNGAVVTFVDYPVIPYLFA